MRSKDERPKTFVPKLHGNACYAGYFIKAVEFCFPVSTFTVADPDLQIRRGVGVSKKFLFGLSGLSLV